MKYQEIETRQDLINLLQNQSIVTYKAFQNLDFRELENLLTGKHFEHCLFLGCQLPEDFSLTIKESFIFPQLDLPYNSYINKLYSREDLYKGYILGQPETFEKTFDQKVYRHYLKTGKYAKDIKETLARRLHDHAITDALDDFLSGYDEKRIVAIMGGHGLSRKATIYKQVALISKQLTEKGYLMTSGGGPGAMEATHLGAWFAGRTDNELNDAIELLGKAPFFRDSLWLDTAFEIIQTYPQSHYKSLGIPTWLYGHEPATPFATHIAKYFANSVREDGLLTIAKGGVIFAPGSAGTIQEIFQEATQNHYLSFDYASPMIFMNKTYWTKDKPVYSCLEQMTKRSDYKNLILSIYDDSQKVIDEILKFSEQGVS